MRTRRFVTAALLGAALGALPPVPVAHAGDATGALAPYEDVLEVLADLTWHLKDDVYRFAPPKDPTGHDLYRLSLSRLESWEQRYPGRLRDVTAFGRAEALERLGEFARAASAYGDVAAMPSPLAAPARAAADRARTFADADALPESAPDLDGTLVALRKKLDAWGQLVTRHAGTPFEPLALVQEERLERAAARLVVEHRREIERGAETAERSLRFLIEKHTDSKELPAHILRLADLYADLTRDYVDAHGRPLSFDEDEFVQRADRALDTYRKVGTWDGSREKPEAQARFAAFDAYKASVLARYR
jgi:hypothetical protein